MVRTPGDGKWQDHFAQAELLTWVYVPLGIKMQQKKHIYYAQKALLLQLSFLKPKKNVTFKNMTKTIISS